LCADAAAAWEALPRPYEALLAREQQARCLFAADQAESAVSMLTQVWQGLCELGAPQAGRRVALLLREHGAAPAEPWRGGRRGYGTRLSPRELEVVRLVVAGHTNPEIARALYRSPKTVANQLNSAMRKLNVTTRTALAVSVIGLGAIDGSAG
jgi:DNA-binding NarL/FixJ family response regulator